MSKKKKKETKEEPKSEQQKDFEIFVKKVLETPKPKKKESNK